MSKENNRLKSNTKYDRQTYMKSSSYIVILKKYIETMWKFIKCKYLTVTWVICACITTLKKMLEEEYENEYVHKYHYGMGLM